MLIKSNVNQDLIKSWSIWNPLFVIVVCSNNFRGVHNWAAFDFIPPPRLWFYSPQCIASHRVVKSMIFSHKAIKQCTIGLNSVKLCSRNQVIPFGTTKSIKSLKIFFFLFFQVFDFFSISKPFDFIPRRHGGVLNCIHPRIIV